MEKILLTMKEACEAVGVKKDSIYRAINAQELKSVKLGRRRLFRPESLREWAAKLESETVDRV